MDISAKSGQVQNYKAVDVEGAIGWFLTPDTYSLQSNLMIPDILRKLRGLIWLEVHYKSKNMWVNSGLLQARGWMYRPR